jgi:hypothetical protein
VGADASVDPFGGWLLAVPPEDPPLRPPDELDEPGGAPELVPAPGAAGAASEFALGDEGVGPWDESRPHDATKNPMLKHDTAACRDARTMKTSIAEDRLHRSHLHTVFRRKP